MSQPSGPPVLTTAEIATLGALVERMFPADELGPGAREIGVVEYICNSLAGPYKGCVASYRRALAALDRMADRQYGKRFVDLAADQQDLLIKHLECGRRGELELSEGQALFDMVWQHLREGLFSDPVHRGNRDMLGWRLIGFPGAQWGYVAGEQEIDAVIIHKPRSVANVPRRGRGFEED